MIRVPKLREAVIRQEGTRVLLIIDGRLVLDVDWATADGLANGLKAKARAAEEIAKAETVAMDAALLLRSGAPFGITSHPAIRAMARTAAAWDRTLRRFLPGGIKSKEQFGRPAIERTTHRTEALHAESR